MLVVAPAEFAGERIGEFRSHHLKPGAETMPGTQNSGEKVERFGKLLGKDPLPLGILSNDQCVGDIRGDAAGDGRDQRRVEKRRRDHEDGESAALVRSRNFTNVIPG